MAQVRRGEVAAILAAHGLSPDVEVCASALAARGWAVHLEEGVSATGRPRHVAFATRARLPPYPEEPGQLRDYVRAAGRTPAEAIGGGAGRGAGALADVGAPEHDVGAG